MNLKVQLRQLILMLSFCLFIKNIRSRNHVHFSQNLFDSGKNNFEWVDALNVMSYHRSKMNEYLCKSYLAREIIDSYKNLSGEQIEKRSGKPSQTSLLVRDSLLKDPGSQKYKDWLSKSSTLEDIYRQFEHLEHGHNSHHDTEQEHEGEVTGYALLSDKNVYPKPIDFGGVHSHYVENTYDPHSHDHYDEDDEHEEKGMKLKELFHFALTAIAFLAFATFMIEVIMFLMEVPSMEPDYVVLPTATGTTGSASKIQNFESEIKRQGRFLPNLKSLETLNNMCRKVLSSIEGFALFNQDNGKCLQKALCQNSEYSKSLTGTRKLLLPIWSLGASWLGGRLLGRGISSNNTNPLEFLKAMVAGLGKVHCEELYSECDASLRRKKNNKKTN